MKTLLFLIPITFFLFNCNQTSILKGKIYEFADTIEFIDLSEFPENRQPDYLPEEYQIPLNKFYDYAKTLNINEVEGFLQDKNPNVRGLGLLALYQLNDQKAMLKFADFLKDSNECFKVNWDMSSFMEKPSKSQEKTRLFQGAKDVMVAEIAKTLFMHYFMYTCHMYFNNGFNAFLEERKNLEYTAGFLRFLYTKARNESSTFHTVRQLSVDSLRQRIERIPNKVDRAIYKIYLSENDFQIFNQFEMINELKFLGKDRVKAILTRNPPTNDPDLLHINDSECYDQNYVQMCKWLLQNANVIFNKADVSFFLERAKYEFENTKSWRMNMDFIDWYVACSKVDSKKSSEYIKMGIDKYKEESFR
jgi:hypothetical protein